MRKSRKYNNRSINVPPKDTRDDKEKRIYLKKSDMMEELRLSHELGKPTDELVKMFVLLSKRYVSKPKFRVCDSFKDDMLAFGVSVLFQKWDKFDMDREDPNPFAYFTSILTNAFYQHQNYERNGRRAKNIATIIEGLAPSDAFMVEYEQEFHEKRAETNPDYAPSDIKYYVSTGNGDELIEVSEEDYYKLNPHLLEENTIRHMGKRIIDKDKLDKLDIPSIDDIVKKYASDSVTSDNMLTDDMMDVVDGVELDDLVDELTEEITDFDEDANYE